MSVSTTRARMPGGEFLQSQEPRVLPLVWAASARARNRAFLFAASLASVLAVAVGQSWFGIAIAVCGVLGYSAMVLHDVFDPQLIRRVHRLPSGPSAGRCSEGAHLNLPLELGLPAIAIEPVELRDLLRQILIAHEAVRAGLLRLDPRSRAALKETYQRCTEMAKLATPLICRGVELQRYLALHDQQGLEADIDRIQADVLLARDTHTRAILAAAVKMKLDLLATFIEVESFYCRMKAELLVIRVALESVHGRIVKLHASEDDAGGNPSVLLAELRTSLSTELGSLEIGIEELNTPW